MMPRQSAGGLHTVTMCEYLGRGDGMVRKQQRSAGRCTPWAHATLVPRGVRVLEPAPVANQLAWAHASTNRLKRRAMGSVLAWYSGCHCTPNIKGASGRSMASITPSGAMALAV